MEIHCRNGSNEEMEKHMRTSIAIAVVLGMALTSQATLIIDQQWANEAAAKTGTGNLTFTTGRGQTFVPDEITFAGIEFLADNPGGAKTVNLEFEFAAGFFPGNFSAPTATFSLLPIPAGTNWITLDLAAADTPVAPIPVTPGGAQLYSFGLRDLSGNLLGFHESVADEYTHPCCGTGGFSGIQFSGAAWSAIGGNRDIAFRTLAIPEPSTLALLALGGLAAIRGRVRRI